ncbi:MAG: enoyl-CoA hydratase-related protein [Streptosporangiaceae bacterium]
MSESVLYGLEAGVATITMNRPEAMNSLTVEMKLALLEAVSRAAADPAVRAVVLTGSGKAFCAGQDLREHADNLASGRGLDNTVVDHYNPLITLITQMPKPVIAVVNGVAAGAGAALAFACDLRLVAEEGSFILAFTKVGLAPDSGASWTLPRLVGRAKATELLFLASPVDAPTALSLGLANTIVGAAEARDFVLRLASGPTAAYAAVKQALDFAEGNDLAASLAREAVLQEHCAATQDHQVAVEAFLTKQKPVFQGS